MLVVLLSVMSLYFVDYCSKKLIDRLANDLDWNVSDSLIFTEIACLPNSLLFLSARICCVDLIKLICAQ